MVEETVAIYDSRAALSIAFSSRVVVRVTIRAYTLDSSSLALHKSLSMLTIESQTRSSSSIKAFFSISAALRLAWASTLPSILVSSSTMVDYFIKDLKYISTPYLNPLLRMWISTSLARVVNTSSCVFRRFGDEGAKVIIKSSILEGHRMVLIVLTISFRQAKGELSAKMHGDIFCSKV